MRPRGGVIFLRIDLAHMFQKDISCIPSHPFRIKLQVMCSYNTYIYVNCHFQYGQAAIGKQQAGKIIAQKRNLRLNDACEKLQVLGDGPYPGINYIAKCYSFIVENMASSLAISGPRKKGQFGLLLKTGNRKQEDEENNKERERMWNLHMLQIFQEFAQNQQIRTKIIMYSLRKRLKV